MRAVLLMLCLFGLAGCQVVGGAIENYKRDSTHEVKAEYRGLEGKTFAVVVVADRAIQSDHPTLVDHLTQKITERLSAGTITPFARGYVPAADVLRYVYDNPAWTTRPMTEVARGLGGVERIVYVELAEYQLREPGNSYEWDGLASGTVSVLEMDGPTPDQYAFQKAVAVRFPDGKGYGPDQMSASTVMTELARRFVDRATWAMYDHQEPYYPDY
jgi:hypothetical protein